MLSCLVHQQVYDRLPKTILYRQTPFSFIDIVYVKQHCTAMTMTVCQQIDALLKVISSPEACPEPVQIPKAP